MSEDKMNRPRQPKLQTILEQALDVPPEELDGFLVDACGDNELLRSQVERLLKLQSGAHFPRPPLPLSFEEERLPEIDHYEFLQRVGEGGMGVVFEALRVAPVRERVAVKVIRGSFDSEELAARFALEKETLETLEHPYIARIVDSGTTSDASPFIATEFVEGLPLADYCDQHQLTAEETLLLFQKICRAVEHAHSKGVIHRDLKPSNILVAEIDGTPSPKILDFGIAKVVGRASRSSADLTQIGQAIGTPAFMSPEQLDGGDGVSTGTDVYALGTILYMLLTGDHPLDLHPDLDRGEVERRIRSVDPVAPSRRARVARPAGSVGDRTHEPRLAQLPRHLQADLDQIALMALRKEPDDRYLSVRELTSDIDRFHLGQPVVAHPPSWGYRLRKFVRAHRLRIATVALLLAAALGWVGTWVQQQARVADERDQKEAALDFLIEFMKETDPTATGGSTLTARELLDRAAQRLESELQHRPRLHTELATVLGEIYLNLGIFEASRDLLEQTCPALDTSQPRNIVPTLLCYDKLVQVALWQDDLPAAQSFAEQARLLAETGNLEPRAEIEHHRTLGALAQRAGDYAVAERHLTAALQLSEQTSKTPEEHAQLLADVAALYSEAGSYEEAAELFDESVDVLRQELTAPHPRLSRTLLRRAVQRMYSGNLGGAKEDLNEALEANRLLFGADHLEVGRVLLMLGGVHWNSGDLPAAAEALTQGLNIAREQEGPDSMSVAVGAGNLGVVLQDLGRFTEAEAFYKESLETSRKIHGRHPFTATTLNNLGVWADETGRIEDAEQYHEEALAIRQETLGDEHPAIAESLSNLASIDWQQGRVAEARRKYENAVARTEEALGSEHRRTISYLIRLAGLERSDGRTDVALALYDDAMHRLQADLGTGHYLHGEILVGQSRTRADLGDFETGRELATSAAAQLESTLSADAPQVIEAWLAVGLCEAGLGRFADAERSLNVALNRARDAGIERSRLGKEITQALLQIRE